MTDVADMSADELRALAKAAMERDNRQAAAARERQHIAKLEARQVQVAEQLKLARVRLAGLESGATPVKPPRAPKPGDHVVTPPTGRMSASRSKETR